MFKLEYREPNHGKKASACYLGGSNTESNRSYYTNTVLVTLQRANFRDFPVALAARGGGFVFAGYTWSVGRSNWCVFWDEPAHNEWGEVAP